MKRKIFDIPSMMVFASLMLLTSCAGLKELNKEYTDVVQPQIDADTYGNTAVIQQASKTSSLGDLSWRTLFNDHYLEALVDSALAHNLDMEVCRKRIQEAEISLDVAKKAFLPSVSLSPNGSITHIDGTTMKLYDVPLNIDWQVDIFGSLRNAKKSQRVLLERSQDVMQAVQCKLVANISSLYYQLLMLDRSRQILLKTEEVWKESVETQKALMQAGMSSRAAVDRLTASYYSIKAQILDNETQILTIENVICRLMGEAPHKIARGVFGNFTPPAEVGIGIPLEVLQNRPDVRSAQKAIEAAFYNRQVARADMYPKLTLGGSAGWMNGTLGEINPAEIMLNALASLTAPLFAQGKLSGNLKMSEIEMEIAQKQFVQTVLDAGNDVNTALIEFQAADRKGEYLKKETESLAQAYDATCELMNRGRANYLEVLTAQESLLTAQLAEVVNAYNKASGLINLYIALGGGR